MSSVSSVNPGVADLFNWLSSTGSTAVTSELSSPSVQSALESSSPGDLVQLSRQALQLQQAASLFGDSDTAQASATPESQLLQALTSSISGSTGSTGSAGSESTSSAAATSSAFALEQASQLFGTSSNSGSYSVVG